MSWLLKAMLLVAGLALFGWSMSGLDMAELGRTLARVGVWAPLILVPYFVVYLVDCLAWKQTLPSAKIPFFGLFRIRWAGESVNNVIPSAYIGGEAVKVWLLRKRGIAAKEGATSAVVSKTAQTVAQVGFILAAALFFFVIAPDQPGLRAALLAIIAGALAALGALGWIQSVGLFRVSYLLARALPGAKGWIERKKHKLLEFDETTFQFYRNERPRFYKATSLYFAGFLLDTLEIFLAAHLLGLPISWPQALVVEAFAGVAKIAGLWVPGSLGVQESGIVAVCRLAGLPDSLGVAYALIRRGRDVIFAAIGWLLLWIDGAGLRAMRAEMAAPAQEPSPIASRTPTIL